MKNTLINTFLERIFIIMGTINNEGIAYDTTAKHLLDQRPHKWLLNQDNIWRKRFHGTHDARLQLRAVFKIIIDPPICQVSVFDDLHAAIMIKIDTQPFN
ncbi:hypothetical protein BW685_27820 [Burkholderia ubonensis]|uniref:Uncharacterized protein n=1 Tax=Burkholderia ubonensis TaxID=101571 RepID=A0A1R1J4F8_9BURK|nr:hypothetical protein BW685_27820 [Burkholderia ubonensis]